MSYWEFEDLRREAESAGDRFGASPEGQARALRHLWSAEIAARREVRFAQQRQWMKTLIRRHAT
ncbi:MAG TPA: hypothetical protein VLI41_02370 [Phenylobacterium sp.]|uniref:hypothetical protein n=1 Tax=Phenylobacterium sp. TaxID=1871053 RepID=UPI002BED36A8|nr:hypothetical protein [Phenylobacterium sp.]HSV02025.1 hypothetical protein [Phenylobacterium sp.]